MKSVFSYTNYRNYLKEFFSMSKRGNPSFTLVRYADKLGIGRSTLKMVLSGKRNLTLAQIHLVAVGLKLSIQERGYFEALVLKERSKISSEKSYYNDRVSNSKKAARLNSIALSKKELLSDPLVLPILVYLTDFRKITRSSPPISKNDIQQIAKKFGIGRDRVEAILKVLLESEVILDSSQEAEIHFIFDKLNHVMSQKRYLKNWLSESSKRIEKDFPNTDNYFTASTISLTKDDFLSLRSDLKTLLDKYMAHSNEASERSVIAQVGIQLFPILQDTGDSL